MEEGEKACEEAVLKVCSELRVCAEEILTVCKVYLKSSLRWIFAITGSDLEKRARSIPAPQVTAKLDWGR